MDPMERSYTWIASSAATWFLNFLNTNGAKNWSNKFFQAVIANGTQGGSTYDCIDMGKHQCPGPVNKECKTYTPPPAFYVHIQMGNLYGAYTKLWGAMVEDGIKNLASGIKEIVEEYGTPPKDENSGIVDMLVGIMTSLLGLAVERDPALEGPMTFLADISKQLLASISPLYGYVLSSGDRHRPKVDSHSLSISIRIFLFYECSQKTFTDATYCSGATERRR